MSTKRKAEEGQEPAKRVKGGKKKPEAYVLLFSRRLNAPLAVPVRQTPYLKFALRSEFRPRFTGLFDRHAPREEDMIQLNFVRVKEDGGFAPPKLMGKFDFATMDLTDVIPHASEKEREEVIALDEEEEEAADEEDEDYESDSAASASSSDDDDDDSRDADYREQSYEERLNACPSVFYWSQEQSHWEFKFKVDRDNRCLLLLEVRFKVIKKKKDDKPVTPQARQPA